MRRLSPIFGTGFSMVPSLTESDVYFSRKWKMAVVKTAAAITFERHEITTLFQLLVLPTHLYQADIVGRYLITEIQDGGN